MYEDPKLPAWLCRWGVGNATIVRAGSIEEARDIVRREHRADGPIAARLATQQEAAPA
jgi:hypothetical protein